MTILNSFVARDGFVPTKSDTTADPSGKIYGLYVGGTGDVKGTTEGGTAITFTSVPAGTILPWVFTRIWTTGTTATNLVAGKAYIPAP